MNDDAAELTELDGEAEADELGASDEAVMSIGALSRATGIPVATLRSWERRYGVPTPERRASGHRRYPVAMVERLRLVHRALELGNRPSEVVHASDEALSALVGLRAPELGRASAGGDALDGMLSAVRALDPQAFDHALRLGLDRAGVRAFVYATLLPLLRRVGEAWARGDLGVVHEHFASERLRLFLADRWRGCAQGGLPVVCAGLSGEQHDLGLHIAALLLGLSGASPVFLGGNTPVEDIAGAARQRHAVAVLVGSSPAADAAAVLPLLGALRRLLPADTRVAVGGLPAGAPQGVEHLQSFEDLEAWAASL